MKCVGWLCLVVGVVGCGGTPGPANVQAQDKKEAAKGTVVELGDLRSAAPAEWKEEQTTSSMRAYQFRLPHVQGEDEDAELVIFYFGPGGGGSAADNIKRWKGFFTPPEGKTVDDISR